MKRSALCLGLLLGGAGNCQAMSLEEQFSGLATCSIENVYLDAVTLKPRGEYFTERNLEPCRMDEAAHYCLSERFHGLKVNSIVIPFRGPFSVHGLFLSASVETVRKTLGPDYDGDGISKPILAKNPKNPEGAMLYCDPQSQ